VKHININKKCNGCEVELILNDNYKQYRYDQKDYTCTSCWSTLKKQEHIENMYVNGKYVSRSHPFYKPGSYKTFEGAAFSSLSNYEKTTEGYVYIITNPAWKGWVKVGMAIDANDRCNQYQTSSPMRDYKLAYSKYFKHRRVAESKAHKLCGNKATENNNEWFKININDAINLIESITEEQNERETA
jgi:hypothetical protein